MKKVNVCFCIILLISFLLPCFATEMASTFKQNALYEIQNGKVTKTSGEYTKIYTLEGNNICEMSSKNEHYPVLSDNEKRCFNYTYIPTMHNTGYFLVIDKGQRTNAVMQFSADFKTMTLYQYNGLDTHCTVWFGKAL